ncbi:hypothetical protein GH868_30365 [Bacillus thuringiensis]|nr:hypothetical protein [Bacillus thuringiensis]
MPSTSVAKSMSATVGASTSGAAFDAKLPRAGIGAKPMPVPFTTVSRGASATPNASAAYGTMSLSVC